MKKPLQVLQVGMTKNIGGIETYLIEQYRHIDKSKFKYDFVNITGEYDIAFQNEILSSGSQIFNIISRHKNPIKHYWQWIKLMWDHKGEYDIIVYNTNSLDYIFPIFISFFGGIKNRIIHSHNSDNVKKKNIFRNILNKFNFILMKLFATKYFACSQLAGEWMFRRKDGFHIIHNAIDTKKFVYDSKIRDEVRKKLNLEGKFILGHIGRFAEQKNHHYLIDIFSELLKMNNNSILLLVGSEIEGNNTYQEIRKKVRNLRLDDKVYFLGSRNDIDKLLQAIDCFVMPSLFEGLSIVCIEAQTSGLRCYISDTITNEIDVTNNVVFLPLNNEKIWSDKIYDDYISNDILRKSDNIFLVKKAGFDINEEVKKIEQLFLSN